MQDNREVTFAPGLMVYGLVKELKNQGKDYMRLMSYYSAAMLEVETKFKVLNIEFNGKFDRNPIESISTRLKKPQSILEKLQRKGLSFTCENAREALNDIAGVRVICNYIEDIHRRRPAHYAG